MKVIFTLFILLVSIPGIGQIKIKGTIYDSETHLPISYVNIWVEGENIGTTSDLQGRFTLKRVPSKRFVLFSAIGYKTSSVSIEENFSTINLVPEVILLDEVLITKNIVTRQIAPFKKSDITSTFVCSGHPWIIARLFPYDKSYSETPYLKSLVVLTESEICKAKFNIRLYTVGENGQPTEYLHHENILAVAKKGKKKTKVDLTDFNIIFPEKGLFVALEWLIIAENKPSPASKDCKTSFNYYGEHYQPGFGSIASNKDKNSWYFVNGSWRKFKQETSEILPPHLKNKYHTLAIDLELSN